MPRRQDKNIASIGKYFCHCTHPSPGTLQCKDFLSWVSPSTLSLTDFTVPSFCRSVQLPIESIYISEIQTLLGQGVPNLVQVPILVWKRFRSVCPKPATLSLSFSCHVYKAALVHLLREIHDAHQQHLPEYPYFQAELFSPAASLACTGHADGGHSSQPLLQEVCGAVTLLPGCLDPALQAQFRNLLCTFHGKHRVPFVCCFFSLPGLVGNYQRPGNQ